MPKINIGSGMVPHVKYIKKILEKMFLPCLETYVESKDVSQDGNCGAAVDCSTAGVCSTIPSNDSIEITLALENNIFLIISKSCLLPATIQYSYLALHYMVYN